jgi:hypothetical protein
MSWGVVFVLSKYTRTSKDHIDEHDELCFVPDGIRSLTPELFSSDEGLAIAMERQAERQAERARRRQSQIALLEMLFSRPIIAGFIFVIVMFALIAAMFLTPRSPDVLAIMGSIAGAAAALYFATPQTPTPSNPTGQALQIPPEN